jgi:DNA-binding response OmpR family regulator
VTTPQKPVVLGLDEDRAAQVGIAQTFNQAGVFYRFITDRRKLAGGLAQLKPDLLVLYGELGSDFVIQVLDALASDMERAELPVILVSRDIADAEFVAGLRAGVVAFLPGPFAPEHVGRVRTIWGELAGRTGVVSGAGDTALLIRLSDHLRRTRRTGLLTIDPRTPNEGRASFVRGRLERATFLGALGADALRAMLVLPRARYSFAQTSGGAGDGAGVVIEVGDIVTGETEVVVGEELGDEPLGAFEVGPGAPPAPAITAPRPPSSHPVARLLLVDDDESLLRMFSTLFKKHGFDVATAADGQIGGEVALQREFDLVLADLNMPHLDGWGLLRLLRDDFRTRELPLAFISAHDDYRESLRALNAGAQAYISKGLKLDLVVAQATRLLEPRRTALAQLEIGVAFDVSLLNVGPQWFLRELAHRRISGNLDARDGWATYRMVARDGTVVHASAQAGKYSADGERAFNAFVASRAAEGTFTPGPVEPIAQNLFLPTEVMLERACSTLNENERRLRENLMISATQVEVNPELYQVYRQVGPKAWLEISRLICEEHLPPRDIISRQEVSPLEVEEIMRDLIRRGVVTLRKQ